MVWPGVMSSCLVRVSTMASEPQSLQGVVVQTWRKYFPTGSRLNLLLGTERRGGLMGNLDTGNWGGGIGGTLCRRWRLRRLALGASQGSEQLHS